jgi:hypothetical protein
MPACWTPVFLQDFWLFDACLPEIGLKNTCLPDTCHFKTCLTVACLLDDCRLPVANDTSTILAVKYLSNFFS